MKRLLGAAPEVLADGRKRTGATEQEELTTELYEQFGPLQEDLEFL